MPAEPQHRWRRRPASARSRPRASSASTTPRIFWPCCSVQGGWNASLSAARRRSQRRAAASAVQFGGEHFAEVLASAPLMRCGLRRIGRIVRAAGGRTPCTVDAAAAGGHDDRFDARASTQRPPGVDVARACRRSAVVLRRSGGSAPRRSSPPRGAAISEMPRRSSTRAVAALMSGNSAGCTQPASTSILRACRARRPDAPRAGARAAPCRCSAAGSSGRSQLAELAAAAPNSARRRQHRRAAPRAAAAAPAARAHALFDDLAADVDQAAVLHARRAGGLAGAAGQAAVEVQLRLRA